MAKSPVPALHSSDGPELDVSLASSKRSDSPAKPQHARLSRHAAPTAHGQAIPSSPASPAAARGARGQPVGHPPNKAPIAYPDAARALPGSFLVSCAKIKRRGRLDLGGLGPRPSARSRIQASSRTGEGAEGAGRLATEPNRSRGRGNSVKSRGRALCQCHRCFLPATAKARPSAWAWPRPRPATREDPDVPKSR